MIDIELFADQCISLSDLVISGDMRIIDDDIDIQRSIGTASRIADKDLHLLVDPMLQLRRNTIVSKDISDKMYVKIFKNHIIATSHIRNERDKVIKLCSRFLKYLESYINTYTIIVPIYGLSLRVPSFVFGDITISQADTNGIFRELLNRSENDNQQMLNRITVKMGYTWSVVSLRGELESLRTEATDKVQRMLECLLFSLCNEHVGIKKKLIRLGILSEGIISSTGIVFKNDVMEETVYSEEALRLYKSVRIGSQLVERILSKQYSWLQQMIVKYPKNYNKLEGALGVALRWFYKGWNSDNIADAVLCYIISMESLLAPEREYSINRYIAENIALLIEDNPANRIDLSRKIRNLYALRSKISHAGYEQVSLDQYNDAQTLAYGIISFVGSRLGELKSIDELHHFMAQQRLAREIYPLHIIDDETDEKP